MFKLHHHFIHSFLVSTLAIRCFVRTIEFGISYVWEFHERKEITYDLRTKYLCKLPMTKKRYGSESLSFKGSLLWNTLNDKIKQSPTLAAFKNQIKSWTVNNVRPND